MLNSRLFKDNNEKKEKFWKVLGANLCSTAGFVREVARGLWVSFYHSSLSMAT